MAPRLAAALALAALVVGCGTDEEEKVRETLTRFEAATASKDYRVLCNEVLARELVARLRAVGLPCTVALARALDPVAQPQVTVRRIRVRGDTALAEISTMARGQTPSLDTLRLVKQDGRWRVSSLSGAQPPAPSRDPEG